VGAATAVSPEGDTVRDLFFIVLASSFGTVSRYAVTTFANSVIGQGFPFGTLAVNLLGCFLIGFIAEAATQSDAVMPQWRLPLTVGFLGAFTTFSSFSYETTSLIRGDAWHLAAINIGSNVVLGLLATVGGGLLARAVLAK
jgi:fluoride exporter